MKNGKKSMEDRGRKRATYYLDPEITKAFNKLSALLEKDKSEFANEAFTNIVSENAVLLNKIGVEITPTENNAGEQMNKKLAKSDVNKIQSTFHLNEDIKWSLKRLAGLNPDGKDLSSLVNEAIYDIIIKYGAIFKKHGIPYPENPNQNDLVELDEKEPQKELKLYKKGVPVGWDKVQPTFGKKLLAYILTQSNNYVNWSKDNGLDPKEVFEIINTQRTNIPLATQRKLIDSGCDLNWLAGDAKNLVEVFSNKHQLKDYLVRIFKLDLDYEVDRVMLNDFFSLYDELSDKGELKSYLHIAFDIYKSYFKEAENGENQNKN